MSKLAQLTTTMEQKANYNVKVKDQWVTTTGRKTKESTIAKHKANDHQKMEDTRIIIAKRKTNQCCKPKSKQITIAKEKSNYNCKKKNKQISIVEQNTKYNHKIN